MFVYPGYCKWEYTPTYRGFDSFLGFYLGSQNYFTHDREYKVTPTLHCLSHHMKGSSIISGIPVKSFFRSLKIFLFQVLSGDQVDTFYAFRDDEDVAREGYDGKYSTKIFKKRINQIIASTKNKRALNVYGRYDPFFI